MNYLKVASKEKKWMQKEKKSFNKFHFNLINKQTNKNMESYIEGAGWDQTHWHLVLVSDCELAHSTFAHRKEYSETVAI